MSSACYCDYEPASVYRNSEHTARKTHRCRECGRTIQPGERYEYVFAVWDGDASHVRTCSHCLALRNWVTAHVPCSCWTHGNLLEDLRNDVDAYWHQAPGFAMGYLRRVAALKRAQGYVRQGRMYVRVAQISGGA